MSNPFNYLTNQKIARWFQTLDIRKQNLIKKKISKVLTDHNAPFPSYPEWLGNEPSSALRVEQWLTAKRMHKQTTEFEPSPK